MAVFRRRQFSAEKGICHIAETTITMLPDPSGFSSDALTDVIRDGARKLIEQAIEVELAALMAAFAEDKLEDGRARLVRRGPATVRRQRASLSSPLTVWPPHDLATARHRRVGPR